MWDHNERADSTMEILFPLLTRGTGFVLEMKCSATSSTYYTTVPR